MTTTNGSAKIYVFPARGRFAAQALHDEPQLTSVKLPRVARVASGGAWYHEEAVCEEDGSRER